VTTILFLLFYHFFLAQPFSPSSIADLRLWLRADAGVVQSAGVVSQWNDQSGNGFNLTQATTTNRPTLVSLIPTLNNKPVVRFDGTNDFLSVDFGQDFSQPNTYFIVYDNKKLTTISSGIFDGLVDGKRNTFIWNNGIRVLGGTTSTTVTYTKTQPYSYLLNTIIYSSSSSKLYENGNLKSAGTIATDAISGFQIGRRTFFATQYLTGDVAEVLFYNRNLSDSEQQQVEKYLMDKYAPPINLGADINNTYGFCDITLQPTAYFTNYLWSTGASTSTINVNAPGTYWVRGTDIFGRQSFDTIVVNRPHYSSVTLNNQLVCYNDLPTVTASIPSGDYMFNQWSDGNLNQTRQLSQGGTLSYSVRDNQNCTLTSNTAIITYDNSLENVRFGNDTSLCVGNTLQLAVTSPSITDYSWSTGDTTSQIILTTSGDYSLTVTNSNSCSKTDVIHVTIIGESPVINYMFPSEICQNESVIYNENSFVQSGDLINSRVWDFGNSTTSNLSSSSFNNPVVGSYNGTLTVTSDVGCQSIQSFSYTVRPKPLANFTSPPLCDNVTGLFTNVSSAPSSTITASQWLVDDVHNASTTNLNYAHPTVGNYNLKLIVTNSFGCMDTSSQIQQVINTYPIPNAPYLLNPFNGKTVLSNEQVPFSWSTVENNYFYEIQFSNSSNFSPVSNTISTVQNNYTYTPNTVGTIYWRVKANNPCLLGGISPIFSINSIEFADSLRLWLRADNGVTVNGSSVNSWLDGSSNGLNAIQNTPANQPIYIPTNNTLNQKPSIKFDGVNDVLTGSLIPRFNSNSLSVFVVGNGGNQSTTNAVMFSSGASSTGWLFTRRASAGRIGVINNNNVLVGATTVLPNSGYDFKLFGYNKLFGTSAQIKVNGINEISSTTAAAIGGFTNANYQVGAGNSTNFFNGEIAEIIAFTKTLTLQEQTNVEKYLMDKYARPIDLGPDIISNYGFCDITLSSNGYFQSYSWSTGATTSSIQINEPGIYSVQAVDIFGRTSQDQIVVSRPVYDSISLTNQLVCYNAPQSYTAFVPNDYQFVSWSDGILVPSRILSEPTSFSYTVLDSNNCQRISNTATITIDSTLAVISLGTDTSLCIGNIISLVSAPTNISSYLWNDNSTTSTFVISAPEICWVEVTNTNNCSNRDSISINIIGTAPILQYSFSDTLCQFSLGSYSDSSFVPNNNGTINNKTWSISEGSFYSGSSGTFAIDTAGTFNVTLLVETEQGCSSSTTFPLTVHPKPILSFTTQNYCPYEEVQFTPLNATLSTLNPSPITLNTFLWNFNQNNNTSSSSNPSYSFGQTDTYNVSLEAQDINGCRDTITQAVFIQPAPIADFSFNNTCEETGVNFVNNSNIADTFNITTNAWSYGDGTQAINPSIQKVYADADTFDVQLIVTANNGCQDTSMQSIIIYPRPSLAWQVGPACKNTWTTFENLSSVSVGNIAQTDWLVNLQYPLEGFSSAYQFVTTGVQYLNLTSTTDNGCQRDTLIIVNVQPEINASYTVSPQTIVAGVPTTFTSTSTGANQYTWNLGNSNIIQTTVAEPVEAPGFDGTLIGDSIQTSLIIENTIGCRDTATQYIKVYEPRIDLAITQLFVQDLNGFYKVGVELRNQGFIEITQTDLVLKMYGSMPILETENESLVPGESRIYLFNASPSAYISTQDNETSYLCVEATSYNDYQLIETELSNNISCLNTEGNNLVLLPIFPNPTNDDITYTFILSAEATIKASLTDQTGRIVMIQTDVHPAGLHTQLLSMRNLRAGVYYFHISDGTSAKTVKILKN
jgi:PKD repeat protein